MENKATQTETELRTIKVASLLMRGRTRSYILEYAARYWKIKRAAADNLIQAANHRILEINEGTMERNQALIANGLWTQYRNAAARKETGQCISALKELSKVYGLDQGTLHLKVDRPFKDLSDEELAGALNDHSWAEGDHGDDG